MRLHLRVDFVEAVERFLLLRRRVVDDVLVVDRVELDVLPGRLLHGQPQAIRLEAPFEQPLRLVLLLRDETDDVLAETLGNRLGLDVRVEAVLVLACREFFDGVGGRGHESYQQPMASIQLPACGPGAGRGSLTIHTLNEVPHPQLDLAFGLLKMKPLLTRLVS